MLFSDLPFEFAETRRSLSLFCRLFLVGLALTVFRAGAHNNPGYYHGDAFSNGQAGFNPNWMEALDDEVRVNDLSVPGTHESMAKYGGDSAECQSMTLSQQLASGIRALDIRVKLDAFPHDGMRIWHGITYQHAGLDEDVFAVVETFLKANKNECVFIDIQNEAGAEVKTARFAEEMNKLRTKYASVIWKPTSQNPKLKELRGKIVLIPHWGMPIREKTSVGLDTSLNGAVGQDDSPKGSDPFIQNRYKFTTNWDQYDKWLNVRRHLGHTTTSRDPGLYQNWLNGSGGSFPYFVASGHSSHGTGAPRLATGCTTTWCGGDFNSDFPRTACVDFGWFGKACTISFEGINTLTMNFINRGVVAGTDTRLGRVGMIFADYPGKGLIEAIIGQNGVRRVTNTDDSGLGSLRWAIENIGGVAAVGDFKGGKIVFDKALSGATIELSSRLLINKNVSIDASDLTNGITISGGNNNRVFAIGQPVHVKLSGLTITRGFAAEGDLEGHGAGIYSGAARLEVTACTLYNNVAKGRGGAIFHGSIDGEPDGVCFITNSTIVDNTAEYASVYNGRSVLTVRHCTVVNNVNDSFFIGAGIVNHPKGRVSLSNSIIAGNRFVNAFDDLEGMFTASAPNIIGTQFSGSVTGVSPIRENPLLRSLRENGDTEKVSLSMLPDTGSPALKGGKRILVSVDQNGKARHQTQPTIGALEVQADSSFQLIEPGKRILEKHADSMGFGNIDIGKALYLLPTIANRGNLPLSGLRDNLLIDGPDASMFKILDLPSAEIGPLVSTNLRLSFVPTSPGLKVATLHFSSNDPTQESYALTLTGVGNETVSVDRSTRGRPSWQRPGEGRPPTELSASATATPYDVVAFSVSSPAKYRITSQAPSTADWDLFLLLYSVGFDSGAPMTNVVSGSRGGPANVATISLHPGVSYYAVTTGLFNTSFGGYTLEITGPEKVKITAPASSISPKENQIGVSVQPTLSWSNTADADYEVFFGNTPDGLESLGFKTSLFTLDRVLNQNTRYFWRLDSHQGNTLVSSGISSFTTGSSLRVTTAVDENDGVLGRGLGDSLREVIAVASNAGGGVTVQFASSLSGATIALEKAPLVLDSNITIDATSLSDRVTINAAEGFRVFEIGPGTAADLRSLRITGGSADNGGGIRNDGAMLTLFDCEVSINTATLAGGAVYNGSGGKLIVERSVLSSNTAAKGAGIFSATGSELEVRQSKLSGNNGDEGGAIYIQAAGFLIERSSLIGNGGNAGGAITNFGGMGLIENSTLSGNGATGGLGGGLHSSGDGSVTLRHCTVVENIGAGIHSDAPAKTLLENSIVANNLDLQNNPIDLNGDYDALHANLLRVHSGTRLSGPEPLVDDPLLGSLRDGRYLAPLIGSPVLDAGVETADTPSVDQNSQCCRPFGSAPDLGAIESKLKADSSLAWLTFSGGPLSPKFQATEYAYTVTVPASLTSVAVRPAAGARGQSMAVRVNEGEFVPVPSTSFGTPMASEDILLVPGMNTIEVQVTAQNGVSSQSYTITVLRAKRVAAVGELGALVISDGSLSPAFDPALKIYRAVVANEIASTTVSASTADSESLIEVRTNFGAFLPLVSGEPSSPLSLKEGVNSVDVQVVGADGVKSSLYSIAIDRQKASESDASLTALTMSAGVLSPAFFSGSSVYEVTLRNDVNIATVTPTAAHPEATIEVNVNEGEFLPVASGMESSPIDLVAGKNVIEVKVTAKDGSLARSYRIHVSRVIDGLEWISKPGRGEESVLSANGRFVAFSSSANDLVADDTNSQEDVFVHDRQTGTIKRISVSNDGAQGDAESSNPSISADGRYVAFQSEASTLVPDDRNGRTSQSAGRDIFVYDLTMDSIERVSLTEEGSESNQQSRDASISADGRYVAFASGANNLISGFRNGNVNVYVRDRIKNTIVGIAVPFADIQTNRNSLNPVISADGRFVAFEYNISSSSDNSNERYKFQEIYLFDRLTRSIEGISGTRLGLDADGDESSHPSISADGRFVAFQSDHEDIDFFDTNRGVDVFVYDRIERSTRRISSSYDGVEETSRNSINPAISGDGRFVAFESTSSKLVEGDVNGQTDIFVKDLLNDTMTLKSISLDGQQGNGNSTAPSISSDGQFVSFQSRASNLDLLDSNRFDDIYLVFSEETERDPFADLDFAINFDSEKTGGTSFEGSASSRTELAVLRPVGVEPGSTIELKVEGGEFQPKQSADEPLSIPLSLLGENSGFVVKVTTQDGLSNETPVFITTRPQDGTELFDLDLLRVETGEPLPLTPLFDNLLVSTVYTAIADAEMDKLDVLPLIFADDRNSLTVNGERPNDQGVVTVDLARGDNTITIEVTAENKIDTQSYVVNVILPFSNNAELISLVANGGALLPPFDPLVTEYSIDVAEDTDSMSLLATLADTEATMSLNGEILNSGQDSQSLPLYAGVNTYGILVTAPDGVTSKTYLLNINRPASSNVDLASLILSEVPDSGPLPFNSSVTSYEATYPNSQSSVTLIPTVAESSASLLLNGESVDSGIQSMAIELNEGPNEIVVQVTAGDGVSSKTYTLTIIREIGVVVPVETNVNLLFLSLSAGSLSPAFDQETTEYTIAVENDVDMTTVFPVLADSTAAVSVNGADLLSGIASGPIDLLDGPNVISIAVAGETGNVKVYSVTVTRESRAAEFEIVIGLSGGLVELSWAEEGLTLQRSSDLQTWIDVENGVSPYRPENASPSQFYRLRQ